MKEALSESGAARTPSGQFDNVLKLLKLFRWTQQISQITLPQWLYCVR